jgi:hypothetical protein
LPDAKGFEIFQATLPANRVIAALKELVEAELIEYYDPEYNKSGFSQKIYKVLNERQRR